MKRLLQLFIISVLFLAITKTDLTAREISGSLSAGEGSSFIPIQGSSFSIISDVTSGIFGGNFNILIKSGGKIIYQENNQFDDLYLVFNEPIGNGDIIKLDVIKGIFDFKMSSMDTLPDVIVDAIKQQAPQEYEQLKPLHKRVHKKQKKKKKKKQKKRPVKKRPIKPVEKRVILKKVEPKPEYDSRVLKRNIEPADYIPVAPIVKEPEVVAPKVVPVERKPIPTNIAKPITPESIVKPASSKKSGIDDLSQSIDSINKEISTVLKSQSRAIDSGATKSDIEDIAKVVAPKTSMSSIESVPTAKTFPLGIGSVKRPVGSQSTIDKSQTKIDSFSTTSRPVIKENQMGAFQTQIGGSTVQKPKFETSAPEPEVLVKKIKIQEKIEKPKMKEVIEVTPPPVQEIVKYEEPEIIAPKPEIIVEPRVIEKPFVKTEEAKEKIVITKTIVKKKKKKVIKDEPRVIRRHVQPQEYKSEDEQIPERMSDRVLGNGGYSGVSRGKIRVKAYSNNRPVSAWVEVFKAGTTQRVKTFYTGHGKSLKDVKLPAGIYVIKATYRTATSKRKKTIGRVVLEEGESINKKITFDDSSIKVKATKSGKPIYAKVEVFKSGSKRRIVYEFTSKTRGIANLSLGSGSYDIVVKDHSKTRRFDNIRVRGGQSRTLNADF